jgi:hypothetical protein
MFEYDLFRSIEWGRRCIVLPLSKVRRTVKGALWIARRRDKIRHAHAEILIPTPNKEQVMSSSDALLRALDVSLRDSKADHLDAEHVLALGAALGMSATETTRAVEQLAAESMVTYAWGGSVAVSEKGRAQARGTSAGNIAISIGPGGTYIGQGAQISGSAIGQGAAAAVGEHASVMRSSTSSQAVNLAELAVALVRLNDLKAQLSSDARPQVTELEGAVHDVVVAAREASAASSTPQTTQALERRLDRAKGVLERLGSMTEAAAKLAPVLTLLRRGLGLFGLAL